MTNNNSKSHAYQNYKNAVGHRVEASGGGSNGASIGFPSPGMKWWDDNEDGGKKKA